jgi:hypothetical protein
MTGLTHEELTKVMRCIQIEHRLIEGRNIKYVDLSFDFRTMTYWRVKMRPFGQEKVFTTVRETLDEERPGKMYDYIMDWLKNGKEAKK